MERPPTIAADQVGTPTRKASATEERIRHVLEEETEIEFLDTPLRDALQFVAEHHNIQIVLDEKALGEEGIAPDEPITRTLTGVTLRSVLRLMLRPMGLTYIIEDEVLKITSEVVAESARTTRIYDVRHFSEFGIDAASLASVVTRTVDSDNWIEGATSIALSSDKNLLTVKCGSQTIQIWNVSGDKPQRIMERRMGRGTVEPLNGFLVISHNDAVHEEISHLLETLATCVQSAP